MQFPKGLFYTQSHEWVKDEGDHITVGLTEYAQSQLKDIVYVELPEIGAEFRREESIGVVESVKAVGDVFSPVTGKVTETNLILKERPQLINEDPYGKGWLVKMELRKREELNDLLSPEAYQGSLQEEP